MQNKHFKQLTPQELKIRQIADQYIKIEENTEYLSQIFRYNSKKKKLLLQPDLNLADLKSLCQLIPQICYLLFTAFVKRANLYLSKDIYQQQHQLYCEYLIQQDVNQKTEHEQQYIKKYFNFNDFTRNQNAYGEYVLYYISKILNILSPILEQLKSPADKIYLRQITNLSNMIKSFLAPKIQKLTPKIIILSLEQTQLFRQNSILLKTMNNSIFSAIRTSGKSRPIFTQIRYYQNLMTKNISNKMSSIENYKQIEKGIEQCLRELIKNQIISIDQSLSDSESLKQQDRRMNVGVRPYVIGEVEGKSLEDRKYLCKVYIMEKKLNDFTQKIFEKIIQEANTNNINVEQNQQEIQKPSDKKDQGNIKNDYLLEYIPSKNLLSLRYVTNIELNIENTDLVMYQCNTISYNWTNVTMELVQKSQNKITKRKQRFLSFKTITYLTHLQKPLFKMLMMMDLVMLCAKIAQPELRRPVIRAQDYTKIEQISRKINHLIKVFIIKVQNYYKIISDNTNERL